MIRSNIGIGSLKVEDFKIEGLGKSKEEAQSNESIESFNKKCICDWSTNNEYGFIPNVNCPIHGERVKKSLKTSISYHGNNEEIGNKKFSIDNLSKKAKFWIVAAVIAVFGGLLAWRIILKVV